MKLGPIASVRDFGKDRDFLLYYARVMLREASARRGQNVAWMLAGAARARREAMALPRTPPQMSLL